MARPEIPIDWDLVDELLKADCTGSQIAPHFHMHPDTFYDRVKQKHGVCLTVYSRLKKDQGDSLLKAKQFEKAMAGDNSMLIWLGKNRLKQRDNHENIEKEIHVHYSGDSAAFKDQQILSKDISEKDSIST
jgi:hypothetical protein